MKRGLNILFIGLVLSGGLNMVGCQSVKDTTEEINDMYTDAYINEVIKKNEENKPKEMKEYNISNGDLQHFYDMGYNSVSEAGLASNTDADDPTGLAILINDVVVRTYKKSEFTPECAESLINGTIDALEAEKVLFYNSDNNELLDTNTMKKLTIEYFNNIFYDEF